jgi:methionyl-tRNA synthetase
MEGKQFSTSRGVVVYVGDVLSRYDADPLRYCLTAAGPETQDTDFTWSEFVRRNNDELVATWGNLVNRTLTNVHRNFGVVPEPGELTEADRSVIATVEAGFELVGDLIEGARFKAALAEAMRLAALVNQYTSDQAPWATLKSDRERAGTVLYVALCCVNNLKTLLVPFLPFTCQLLHELLGFDGYVAGPLEYCDVDESDGGLHRVLRGEYESWMGSWAPGRIPPGQALLEPRPLFKKLDPETVVADEIRRMETRARGGDVGVGA